MQKSIKLTSTGSIKPPKVIEDDDFMWLFAPHKIRYHVPATSPEIKAVSAWIDSHPTGWSEAAATFSPSETQIVGQFYAVDFHNNDILLEYTKNRGDDPDSDIHLERTLSTEERAYWNALLSRIEKLNSAEPYATEPPVIPLPK